MIQSQITIKTQIRRNHGGCFSLLRQYSSKGPAILELPLQNLQSDADPDRNGDQADDGSAEHDFESDFR